MRFPRRSTRAASSWLRGRASRRRWWLPPRRGSGQRDRNCTTRSCSSSCAGRRAISARRGVTRTPGSGGSTSGQRCDCPPQRSIPASQTTRPGPSADASRSRAGLTARLDITDDPRDYYPVSVPPQSRLTVTVSASERIPFQLVDRGGGVTIRRAPRPRPALAAREHEDGARSRGGQALPPAGRALDARDLPAQPAGLADASRSCSQRASRAWSSSRAARCWRRRSVLPQSSASLSSRPATTASCRSTSASTT